MNKIYSVNQSSNEFAKVHNMHRPRDQIFGGAIVETGRLTDPVITHPWKMPNPDIPRTETTIGQPFPSQSTEALMQNKQNREDFAKYETENLWKNINRL